MTSTWVTGVASQGWGLIPVWSGLQAPCACRGAGTYPTCTQFPHVFSTDPSTAYTQGEADATAAYSSAQSIGLDGTVIYIDIERYASASCGSSVQKFVQGWVDEMHASSATAGVYGAVEDAASDFYSAASPPDDVWIPKYDKRASVWSLGHGLSDSMWAYQMRIKQYDGDVSQTWGGITRKLDVNLVDATICAHQGSKSYSFPTQTTVAYPSSTSSYFTDIANGINSSSGGLQEGVAVGQYIDPASGLTNGFIYSSAAGIGASIVEPSAYATLPTHVNNMGQVIGFQINSSGDFGFLYSTTTGTFTPIVFPGSTATYPYGINDAGWIAGYYQDSSYVIHCFLDKSGTYTSFDAPTSSGTDCVGLNGIGQIAGASSSGGSFVDDAEGGSPGLSGNFTYYSSLNALGGIIDINNNGAMVVYGNALFADGAITTIPGSSVTWGLNDDAQIAGEVYNTGGPPAEEGIISDPPH